MKIRNQVGERSCDGQLGYTEIVLKRDKSAHHYPIFQSPSSYVANSKPSSLHPSIAACSIFRQFQLSSSAVLSVGAPQIKPVTGEVKRYRPVDLQI